MNLPVFIVAAVGYLLGALPFGWLVARAHGVDIFKVGSGNPGATNVKRVLGAKAGNTVFALDALKGVGAVLFGRHVQFFLPVEYSYFGIGTPLGCFEYDLSLNCSILGLLAAVLGHSFSIFTRLKGGKGVATA